MPKTLLLEIGTEELPSSFVDAALAALPGLVRTKLAGLRLAHGDVQALGTARRLAVIVHGVAETQPDLDEEVTGPPEGAAYKDGKPTRAAEAFAAKLGVGVEALEVVEKEAVGKQKPGRYVVGRRQEKGKDARELIGKALAELCGEIPFRKSMRWACAAQAPFGRSGAVARRRFLAAVVVDVSVRGRAARAGPRDGHGFLAPGAFGHPAGRRVCQCPPLEARLGRPRRARANDDGPRGRGRQLRRRRARCGRRARPKRLARSRSPMP